MPATVNASNDALYTMVRRSSLEDIYHYFKVNVTREQDHVVLNGNENVLPVQAMFDCREIIYTMQVPLIEQAKQVAFVLNKGGSVQGSTEWCNQFVVESLTSVDDEQQVSASFAAKCVSFVRGLQFKGAGMVSLDRVSANTVNINTAASIVGTQVQIGSDLQLVSQNGIHFDTATINGNATIIGSFSDVFVSTTFAGTFAVQSLNEAQVIVQSNAPSKTITFSKNEAHEKQGSIGTGITSNHIKIVANGKITLHFT